MGSEAFCAYCFDAIDAELSKSQSPSLAQTLTEWSQYKSIQAEPVSTKASHPLFVTWNTLSDLDPAQKSLRGCIGTFEALPLEEGLHDYAVTAAFHDTRFNPITRAELPSLSCSVTLLTNFMPCPNGKLDWIIGEHGIRISFKANGRRYSGTYLPDVALEQGWTKEQTLLSLMRKAGWTGRARDWEEVWERGGGECVRYEGVKVSLGYDQWRGFRQWKTR